MADESVTRDPGGQQPEMVKGLEAAARSGSKKPDDHGMRATPETAPEPGSLEEEERRAADLLREAAERDARKPSS
ncbi:hypothetical protein [Methylobacterium oryzisoli]|uniref:hypothetical protein n=1 Tax=Methylobacterium oryzisoli TaxID=3385502 RepID=UPI0038919CF3